MKKLLFVFILLIPVVLGALGFVWWKRVIRAPLDFEPTRVVITKGSGASVIADKLEGENIVRSGLAFKFYVQLTGRSRSIQAGEYRFSEAKNLFGVVEQLMAGPTQIWVSVPEGLRREEVVERFIEGFELSGDTETEFRQLFLSLTKNSEGFLFPDTYLFEKDSPASLVVSTMQSTFEKRMEEFTEEEIAATGLSERQIITLASILERETVTDEERPVVAGILLNRLNADWPLQADATVQYALGTEGDWWPRPISRQDLEINSRYNTYEYPGLPPGPIANPGLSSIKAVVFARDTDNWFYLHDSKGKIHYARTLEEHNSNVARYLGK